MVSKFEYLSDSEIIENYKRLKEQQRQKNKAAYEKLKQNNIECRPLICGSMSRQPFFYKQYGVKTYNFSDIVHDNGMYLPNNSDMTDKEIKHVCDIVNSVLKATNE